MLLSHYQLVCQASNKVGAVQVMRFAEAKDDCDSALKLELNVKTLLRRGTSWLGLQEIDSARKDFKHVLSLEPNNRCDDHLLLVVDCSAASVALTLFCVTAFMLETLKAHCVGLECLQAGCFWH